jgi:DNA-binding MarR family transcriptional regulator
MADLPDAVLALRSFNRFHTRLAGVLDASFMGSGLSLTEARVLFEIATREPALAADIRAELGLDPGYLSRIVARFERSGWITRGRGEDARRRPISLTAEGRAFYDALNGKTEAHAARSLAHLDDGGRAELVQALGTVQRLLGPG